MKMIVGLIILINVAVAAMPDITIKNFTGNFNQLHLYGTASLFQFKGGRLTVEMYPHEDGLLLTYGSQQEFIEDYPESLEDMEPIVFSKLNLITNKKNLELSAERLEMGNNLIKSLKMSCPVSSSSDDLMVQIASSCAKSSRLNVGNLEAGKGGSKIIDFLEKVIEKKGATELENVEFKNSNNDFELKMKLKMKWSVTTKVKGAIHFQEEHRRIRIKVDSAYASIISVKKRLFKELDKMETEDFVVENPYVYIYL